MNIKRSTHRHTACPFFCADTPITEKASFKILKMEDPLFLLSTMPPSRMTKFLSILTGLTRLGISDGNLYSVSPSVSLIVQPLHRQLFLPERILMAELKRHSEGPLANLGTILLIQTHFYPMLPAWSGEDSLRLLRTQYLAAKGLCPATRFIFKRLMILYSAWFASDLDQEKSCSWMWEKNRCRFKVP